MLSETPHIQCQRKNKHNTNQLKSKRVLMKAVSSAPSPHRIFAGRPTTLLTSCRIFMCAVVDKRNMKLWAFVIWCLSMINVNEATTYSRPSSHHQLQSINMQTSFMSADAARRPESHHQSINMPISLLSADAAQRPESHPQSINMPTSLVSEADRTSGRVLLQMGENDEDAGMCG